MHAVEYPYNLPFLTRFAYLLIIARLEDLEVNQAFVVGWCGLLGDCAV